MGDTMVEAEEEATKQEVCSEPLPEPLLIILSPPPPFLPAPGQPTMFWHKWLKSFSRYLEALGEHQLVDSSKCDLLQNCLGPEGRHVFASLIPGDATYAEAVSALTGFFTADQTAQMYRLEFRHRAQMPGETTDQFVSALQELLWRCDFGDSQEKRVLDQLMAKTSYPPLRERLLLAEDTLTLAEALLIGKEVESALSESEAFGFNEVSVAIEDDLDAPVPIKAKRGRPRKGEARTAAKPRVIKTSKKPSRRKDNFCYGNDKLHYSENDKDKCKSSAEATPACDEPGDEDDIEASSSSQAVKEEPCDDDDDDDDDNDEDDDDDFVDSTAKLKGPYCPFCTGRRFRDANKLGRHMRTHTKEKPFSCPVCSLTFSQSYHMTRHLRNQHGAGQHVCSTCGESLGSFAELKSHKRAHSQALSCPECGETFTNHDTLRSHTLSHGKTQGEISQQSDDAIDRVAVDSSPNNDSNDSVDEAADNDSDSSCVEAQDKGCKVNIKMEEDSVAICQDGAGKKAKVASKAKPKGHFCPICDGRRFRGPNKLARHMRTHTKEKPFTCPVCSVTFSQSYHMTRHVRNQHGSGKYICSKCGKGSGSWLELKTHKKTHAGDGLKCLACDTQFKEKAALVSHLKLHKKVHANPRSLICGDCGKVFRRLYHLKRHIKTHRKAATSESFTCPDCRKKFAFPEDLNKHLEVHVKENNGTCPKCDQTFPGPEELETHMEVHDKTYACSTCGKKFKVEYALKKHEQVHQNEQYYCSLCRKRFIKLSHYKRHLLVHERRECKCPHCDSVFLQITALKYHLRTHSEERPHQCVCCIETFEAEEELEQHRLKHRKYKKERPFSCTRCDSAFPTLVALTEHMSEHEGELPSNCPVCGKTFLNKKKLEKHLSIHTGERPHLCSVCGNGFPSAASLKLHVTIHTGEKPFTCSQCAKSFRSSSGLRLHSRQHMEVRPIYECPECGRTYGRMTELKMHQRYHTGDKPYSCTCCNKRFISKDKLNVHMRTHTGERPYSCPHCGQTFTQTGDRNRHISKYH